MSYEGFRIICLDIKTLRPEKQSAVFLCPCIIPKLISRLVAMQGGEMCAVDMHLT